MRIAAAVGTESLGSSTRPADLVSQVVAAEAAGFASAWCVHFSRGIDALSALAAVGAATSSIDVGVGVVPIYPRHPVALAQQAATVQSLIGGRLTLGVGVSHRPAIEGMHGIPYVRPAAYMREYLSVLVPMLRSGKVFFEGEFFRVEAEFSIPDTTRVPVLVGGLSEAMVRVGGELADGVVTWLAGSRTLRERIVPGVTSAAHDAGRPAPRIVAALPVAVCDDYACARADADVVFARYGGLPNYQRQFEREGITSPGEIVVVGSEALVADQLRMYESLGVTEFWPITYSLSEAGSGERTRSLLAGLSAGTLN